ncbi:MAG: helix-turn-helix domain-containing protein, partial [Spirochaetaceae bacterium]|nr:helix-turn-helix domain-containing protein [Spirochaetaceae bacterium]
MESFGKLLQSTRESKQIDIEKVALETTISRNHIIAMENEQIDSFPGEPYLVGFLKNYAEYLGLNPTQVLALYRAKKIQESPAPSALLQRQYPKYLKPLIVSGIILVVVILGLLSWLLFFSKDEEDLSSHTVLGPGTESHRYELTNQALQKRLYEGDVIAV